MRAFAGARRAGSVSLIRTLFVAAALCVLVWGARAAEATDIRIGYLRQGGARAAISLLDIPAANDGVAGAKLAIDDNNTTGRFLNQRYTLEETELKDEDDPATAVAAFADHGISFVIVDLPVAALLKAADAGRARGLLMFNAGATDD